MANETAGKKGQKLARYDLIPIYPLWKLAEVYGRGAAKYADRNWERGAHYSKLYGAMLRHSQQFWAGEDVDPTDGQDHLASVAWMAFALMELQRTHPELDDRPHIMLGQEPQSLQSEVTNPEEIAAAKDEVVTGQTVSQKKIVVGTTTAGPAWPIPTNDVEATIITEPRDPRRARSY